MDLDPVHLRSFEAIVHYGGYHRAAEALHLTQPAVSRHVRRLEDQLGERLFHKHGRGVELTAFGERAAVELGELLATHDRAVRRLTCHDGEGPFVVGTSDDLADPLLPRALAVMRRQLAGATVQLRIGRSQHLHDGFDRGEIDAVFLLNAFGRADAIDLGPLSMRWHMAASLPVPDPLPARLPVVVYDPPCVTRDRALARLDELGVTPEIAVEATHLSGVHAAARQGLGFALLCAGADGLHPVPSGPLAQPLETRLWLLLGARAAPLRDALREALWPSETPPVRPLAATG